MAYNFKVYISDGKEYFEYGDGQKTTKKSFAFSQSLMDLLYLDIWFYGDLFEKMGKAVRSLYSSRDSQWSDEIKRIRHPRKATHLTRFSCTCAGRTD